ncbi:MAG: DUF4143 domain-containing protein [Erysipelotrichaceae bacterium]|nr:DUF4143 domain-containing protein [Erysipelotrichaceae bacterium]
MNEKYIKRLAESVLIRKLHSSGCVLVSGPKFCGKTTMCKEYAKSSFALKDTNTIALAKADVKSALMGETPHLIDEWQKVTEIWNYIKNDLDEDYQFGKYILTGSVTPIDSSKIQHSGAGRITRMILKPFSLFESGESNGAISLKEMFENPNKDIPTVFEQDNNVSLQDICHCICRGGWPMAVMADKKYAVDVTKNYYDGLFVVEDENDDFALFLKNKDIELLQIILKSFARNISTQTKKTKMIAGILESGIRSTLDEDTFNSYEKVLKNLFIIYDMPAWNQNLRTSVAVRSAPTHHFYDTSIATAALGIRPADLLKDLKSLGLFFEDMVVRDLSIYSETNNGELKHYRDSNGQEVDAIIEIENGTYAAIEIKIASEENINDGIKSLCSFEKKMLDNNLQTPLFKMVVTSHGACYKSEEGVYVVPINFLKN